MHLIEETKQNLFPRASDAEDDGDKLNFIAEGVLLFAALHRPLIGVGLREMKIK